MKRDGANISYWQDTSEWCDFKEVVQQNDYDVVIIGAGLTGITTGLMLQKAGKNCLIVEANTFGFGTTSGTSAHLNTVLDTPYCDLIANFGKENAILSANAAKEALKIIFNHVQEFEISCDFAYCDGYMYATNEDEEKELKKIYDAILEVGLKVTYTDDIPGPMDKTKAIKFEEQGRFHPLLYLQALVEEYEKLGGDIRERTTVTEINEENNRQRVTVDNGTNYHADAVVYATHTPPGTHLLTFKLAPYRSYVMGFRLKDDNQYPEDLIYDMQDPFHYFRKATYQNQNILLVGGQDHKTGQHPNPEFNFVILEAFVRKHYAVEEVVYRWSSQYYDSTDGLPYIGYFPGKKSKQQFVATGYSGNGMIFSTLSAKIISDLIVNGSSEYEKLFSPGRIKPIAGFSNFITENFNVAKHLILDRLTIDKIDDLADLAKGEGKIVDYQKHTIGLYKDSEGTLLAVDPVCKHAGCIVQWNNTEKSWDCPCHGARYAPNGDLLTGPATEGLCTYNLDEGDE
ncbi:FAD-dependent oxidoreductase [Sphingobacterium sp. UDSM-2020]|uniref:FAD-dependent oxidoreductase n=1 Tax=Sphingobacterium sp. UDSM-2020 TaxID=2795738 RepID=UPI001936C631|nr:FAD-dependent oxidoreductase [Sphingobacterium sp. UDSM-2020]QQD12744.1 FAD-dependent oxidoreductase [Sphingobacterium sp. UDSM-2020]